MSKQSGGTKTKKPKKNINLIGGEYDPYITDDIYDLYLPGNVRNKLVEVEKISSYNDFKEFLIKRGIELDTTRDDIKNEYADKNIKAQAEVQRKIATAILTYEDVFGKDSLKSLKKIVLYDKEEEAKSAYYYNRIGEDDPKAHSIRFGNWKADSHEVYHELAHALADSIKLKGEDAVSASIRLNNAGKLDKAIKGYFGAKSGDIYEAERFAEAVSMAFTRTQDKKYTDFLNNLRNLI